MFPILNSNVVNALKENIIKIPTQKKSNKKKHIEDERKKLNV
jgi:hypothetical protein